MLAAFGSSQDILLEVRIKKNSFEKPFFLILAPKSNFAKLTQQA